MERSGGMGDIRRSRTMSASRSAASWPPTPAEPELGGFLLRVLRSEGRAHGLRVGLVLLVRRGRVLADRGRLLELLHVLAAEADALGALERGVVDELAVVGHGARLVAVDVLRVADVRERR